jgi:HPt (histidine-containing phosphotransfer) domain-containing protein
MAPHKNTAAIATFGDHEIIKPENKLRDAVSETPFAPGEDEPWMRAELALAGMADEFGPMMESECDRLDKARQNLLALGFTDATIEGLFHAAHDIKGEAATFGFPAVAAAADSLCRLLEYAPDPTRIPTRLIDQHVDAVRAIHREYSTSDAAELAVMLTSRLRDVTDEFLMFENRGRPDILEQIAGGPPIAPE